MCRHRVPAHPWCGCTDHSSPDCPHHVDVDTTVSLACDFNELQRITGPEGARQDAPATSHWILCDEMNTFTTESSLPIFDRCTVTYRADTTAAASAEEPVTCYKLCQRCDKGNGVPLRVVTLFHATEEQVARGNDGESDWWVYWPPNVPKLVTRDGLIPRDEVIDAISVRPPEMQSERVYVHIVDELVNGKWVTDLDRSAIYLLPAPLPSADKEIAIAPDVLSSNLAGFWKAMVCSLTYELFTRWWW